MTNGLVWKGSKWLFWAFGCIWMTSGLHVESSRILVIFGRVICIIWAVCWMTSTGCFCKAARRFMEKGKIYEIRGMKYLEYFSVGEYVYPMTIPQHNLKKAQVRFGFQVCAVYHPRFYFHCCSLFCTSSFHTFLINNLQNDFWMQYKQTFCQIVRLSVTGHSQIVS